MGWGNAKYDQAESNAKLISDTYLISDRDKPNQMNLFTKHGAFLVTWSSIPCARQGSAV